MWKLDDWPALLANQEASSCHWSRGWCSHLGNNKVTHFITCSGSSELSTGSQTVCVNSMDSQSELLYFTYMWTSVEKHVKKNKTETKNFQVLGVRKKTSVNIFTLSLGYPTGCFLRMNCGFKFLHIFEAYDFFLENSLAVYIHLNSHQHYMSLPVCVLFKFHIWTFFLVKGDMHHQRYLLIIVVQLRRMG